MAVFLSKIGLPLAAIVLFRPLVGHFASYLAGWLSTTPFAFTFNHGGDQHGGRWCRVEYGPLWHMRVQRTTSNSKKLRTTATTISTAATRFEYEPSAP